MDDPDDKADPVPADKADTVPADKSVPQAKKPAADAVPIPRSGTLFRHKFALDPHHRAEAARDTEPTPEASAPGNDNTSGDEPAR